MSATANTVSTGTQTGEPEPFAAGPSVQNRFRTGLAWNFLATAAPQGATLVGNILLANILGRASFGEYAVIQSAALAMTQFAQFATGTTAAKYLAEFHRTNPERAGRILALSRLTCTVLSALSSIALLAASKWITMDVLRAPYLAQTLMASAVFLLFSSLGGFETGVLTGLERYKLLGAINISTSLLQILVCAAAAFFLRVPGAVLAMGVTAALRWALLLAFTRSALRASGVRISFRNISAERRILLRVAIPAGITALTMVPGMWLGNAILGRQPNGFSQVAIYAASSNMLAAVMFFPWVVDKVTLSLLNSEMGLGRIRGYRDVFWLNMKTVVGCVLAASTIVLIAGPSLLRLYGKSFGAEGYPTLLLLIAASLPEAITIALNQLFLSRERVWTTILLVNSPRDVVLVGCAYILIPSHGSAGLAMAYLASRLIGVTFSMATAYRVGLNVPEGV